MIKMIIAISLVSVVGEMLLSGSSFKKYVRAVIGVFTFLVIIESVFSLNPTDITYGLSDYAEQLSDLTLAEAEIKLIEQYEQNIKETLNKNNVDILGVNVKCDGNMTIRRIDVKVNDSAYEKEIIRILVSDFGVDENIIKVTKGDNNGAF